jgi:Holliday junction resolvase RusA-like endonuclease
VKRCALESGARPIPGAVSWHVEIWVPDARRRDRDNIEKTLQDALNGVAYGDDSQVLEWGGFMRVDRVAPRVVVRVEAVGP